MFGSSVKLDNDLLKRCRQYAEETGYSSVEEFISHVLERELKTKQQDSQQDQEEVAKRLQGLGYIE
jgi:metal-responsive CopG/Arc/MetJ family transcriptional regulator